MSKLHKIVGILLGGGFVLGGLLIGAGGISHWAETGDRESLYVAPWASARSSSSAG